MAILARLISENQDAKEFTHELAHPAYLVDKLLLAIMAAGAIVTFVRFATGIGTVANINNAYPWGWWVGYGIMTMIAIGGVGFITATIPSITAAARSPLRRHR